MSVRVLKTLFLSFILSIVCCSPVFAASEMPFKAELDLEPVERICYAGHGNGAVIYNDGYAVMPETYFSIVMDENATEPADVSELSAEIALIYENEDNNGSYREILRSYEPGSLNTKESFPLLSENTIANLADRDKLYSGTLSGFVLTLNYGGGQNSQEITYLYVCGEDEYFEYYDKQLSESDERPADNPIP